MQGKSFWQSLSQCGEVGNIFVNSCEFRNRLLPRKHLRALQSFQNKLFSEILVIENPRHRLRQSSNVHRFVQNGRVADHFRYRACFGAHDGSATSHSLEWGPPEAFVYGWKNENVARMVRNHQFSRFHLAKMHNPIREVEIVDEFLLRSCEILANLDKSHRQSRASD